MNLRTQLFAALFGLMCVTPLRAAHVVFADNSAAAGGNGTVNSPYRTIAEALRDNPAVVCVIETSIPYNEQVTLHPGQILIGSAYGLDALRQDHHLELDAVRPAIQGPGPMITGSIDVVGNNIIAGVTLAPARANVGIRGSDFTGTLDVRDVRFITADAAYAMFLQRQDGALTVRGGAITGTAGGNGLFIAGGSGDVTIDRVPLSGSFANAIHVDSRNGAVLFKNGSAIDIADATADAIVINSMPLRSSVSFTDRVQVHAHRRALVATSVAKLVISGARSSFSSEGAAAIDLHDVSGDIVCDSLSSNDSLEGIVVDKLRGRLDVRGVDGEPGSGGTIRGAKNYGLRLTQSDHLRFANMTIAGSGSAGAIKGAKCAGEFDVNTTAPCNAAVYLRHVSQSAFENILVDAGGAIGVNANNIRDVTFDHLEVRNAGDESYEAGVLLQESGGVIRFTNGRFFNNAGSELRIEQRYGSGAVQIEKCELAAADRPQVAPRLLDLRATGSSRLDVRINGSSLHDNAGSAIDAAASSTGTLNLTIAEMNARNLGTGVIHGQAREASRLTLELHGSDFFVPAVANDSLIYFGVSGNSSGCADVASNRFSARVHFEINGPASLAVTAGTEGAPPAAASVTSCRP